MARPADWPLLRGEVRLRRLPPSGEGSLEDINKELSARHGAAAPVLEALTEVRIRAKSMSSHVRKATKRA